MSETKDLRLRSTPKKQNPKRFAITRGFLSGIIPLEGRSSSQEAIKRRPEILYTRLEIGIGEDAENWI